MENKNIKFQDIILLIDMVQILSKNHKKTLAIQIIQMIYNVDLEEAQSFVKSIENKK
ncbi:MAG: hypothetical protein ACOCRX_01465 [Candidatus Woesearchaeota archaeon]